MSFRIGMGFDAHRLVSDWRLVLGGVDIGFDKGLEGHSDGDVVLHALTDALLGTVGGPDIGRLFPSGESQWKGAPSRIFVEKAVQIVEERGYRITQVDIVIIAEAPRLAPHFEAMQSTHLGVARDLGRLGGCQGDDDGRNGLHGTRRRNGRSGDRARYEARRVLILGSMNMLTGFHGVREALRADPGRIRKVILVEGRLDRRAQEIVEMARSQGIPVYRDKARVLDQIASGAHHQGVAAELSGISWWSLDDLLAGAPAPALLLALDGVEDPRNFGAVVRAADGAGAHGIVVPKRRAAPPSDVAIAASAGALLHARLARVTNLSDALGKAKEAEHLDRGAVAVGQNSLVWFRLHEPGPFGFGRGRTWTAAAGGGRRVTSWYPCRRLGRVESLNVSVAAGIVLYEVVRQRLLQAGRVILVAGRK